MGTRSFPGVKCGRGVLLTIHPLLVPRSGKSRAIPLRDCLGIAMTGVVSSPKDDSKAAPLHSVCCIYWGDALGSVAQNVRSFLHDRAGRGVFMLSVCMSEHLFCMSRDVCLCSTTD